VEEAEAAVQKAKTMVMMVDRVVVHQEVLHRQNRVLVVLVQQIKEMMVVMVTQPPDQTMMEPVVVAVQAQQEKLLQI
tara:strand:- start:309 stop:539 length:231 start_codon:yes stop_codon:yes gene_type:complete